MAIQGFITIAFDEATLKKIAALPGFSSVLTEAITAGLDDGAEIVAQAAEQNTWNAFQNPTGELADSIYSELIDPLHAEVVVDKPYANRLEFGFGPGGSAATDSLGRTYHNPPEPYAGPALTSSVDEILELMSDNINAVLGQIGTLP